MHGDKAFVDTNVLVYAYSNREPVKKAKAEAILSIPNAVTSLQALNEYANVMRKRFAVPFDDIQTGIHQICEALPIVLIDVMTVHSAIEMGRRFKYSHYDSLILATAKEQQCSTLYSEDFQDGQVIDGTLRIVNPFR